ncbi:glycine cleavage system H protein [Peptococcaceae bacterium CEB3]|nr:glycine cleavage system H protein [Peptococcaceae bacterium CEB3]
MTQSKKRIEEIIFEERISYDSRHAWVKIEDHGAIIGISDYAQDQLGDLVFVELPSIGDVFGRGEVFGQVESVKSVSSLIMPIGGTVTAINEELEDDPELLNRSPYSQGWIIKVEPKSLEELEELLTSRQYADYLKTTEG